MNSVNFLWDIHWTKMYNVNGFKYKILCLILRHWLAHDYVLTQSSTWSGVIFTPTPQLSSKDAASTGSTGFAFI